jgi:pimeloyl-ACP methyl ester carboxylesterase
MDVALALVRQQAKLDHRDAVRGLKVPVLAAYSTKDPFYPPDLAKWIANTASRGSFELFYESAHATAREEPEKFARVIREFAGVNGDEVQIPTGRAAPIPRLPS